MHHVRQTTQILWDQYTHYTSKNVFMGQVEVVYSITFITFHVDEHVDEMFYYAIDAQTLHDFEKTELTNSNWNSRDRRNGTYPSAYKSIKLL